MKIGIIYDCKKPKAKKLALEVGRWLEDRKHKAVFQLKDDLLKSLDFVVTFGGDGLVLHTANKIAEYKIPLLRINFGRVGFLANIESEEVFEGLLKVIEKDNYIIAERARIKVIVEDRSGNLLVQKDALNDIVIERTSAQAILCEIVINNKRKEYRGDGIIFATRTGSTAYAESVGGPTLIKDNKFILRVISPSDREQLPYLIRPDDTVFEINRISGEARLSVDGTEIINLCGNEQVTICKSPQRTLFIEVGDLEKIRR